MTVDHLSDHLKRDVGTGQSGIPISEIQTRRAMTSTQLLVPGTVTTSNLLFGRVGRLRMRSLWKEAGHSS
jgi:hypothetical protein